MPGVTAHPKMKRAAYPVMLIGFGLAVACLQSGVAKPDFSGTWVLDLPASTLESPPPDSSIFVIDHDEPTLLARRTHVAGGASNTIETRLTTDSLVHAVRVGETEIPTRVYWEGDILVLEQEWSQGSVHITNGVRYTLEDDGRTMIADERMRAGTEGHHNIWVFRRR